MQRRQCIVLQVSPWLEGAKQKINTVLLYLEEKNGIVKQTKECSRKLRIRWKHPLAVISGTNGVGNPNFYKGFCGIYVSDEAERKLCLREARCWRDRRDDDNF
jgi:hypothetical protein